MSSRLNEKGKSGRSPTSCLECQRRKQKCSREWPCNHCQARKVPHLCSFASTRKASAPESDISSASTKVAGKRKADHSQAEPVASAVPDPDQGLSDGLAQLGYMTGHDFFTLARPGTEPLHKPGPELVTVQTEAIELALRAVLPKPYTDVLVQNFLENANYQYYAIFPGQLRDQSAQWWETRAGGRRLSAGLTCLLLRVCAVSTQYLEGSARRRLEAELGEKAQSMTERFHAAAQKLSSSIPRGSGGVIQVQQLFHEACWWKSEANMVEAWHSLSVAVREAQEIGMHKHPGDVPHFEGEIRKRLWCILWTWDWQLSTLLSRPLLIDQDGHDLEIPDGRLESITDPAVPHPLTSIALQASLGLSVSHLFRKMATDHSVQLVLEIEAAIEAWMGTFPASMRDHRPDTHWDQTYANVPFMRSQINALAYCYLLAPLKPYVLGSADGAVLQTPLGAALRRKGVDTCLDLMKAVEQFYDLVFPASVKYFSIVFFLFDAATVLCSALVHDNATAAAALAAGAGADAGAGAGAGAHPGGALPKRSQCLRSLRTAQELMDAVAHVSESARISAQLLRKLAGTLVLTRAERHMLGLGGPNAPRNSCSSSRSRSRSRSRSSPAREEGCSCGGGARVGAGGLGNATMGTSVAPLPCEAVAQQGVMGAYAAALSPDWAFVDYHTAAGMAGAGAFAMGAGAGAGPATAAGVEALELEVAMMQPGDPLTGTYLDQVWDWERLNMDLGQAHFGR